MDETKLENEGTSEQNLASATTVPSSSGSTGSTTFPNETPKGYVTEESYQGLQRVVAKRDKELDELKQKLNETLTSLEEMKSGTSSLSEEKQKLEQNVTAAQQALQNLERERNSLNKQLEQQGVIMSEYPDLATMTEYIPNAETTEEYRENAKKFKMALESYVNAGVKKKLSGSTPPAPTDGKETIGTEEEDRLWREVYKLAGVSGKESEYREKYARLQQILAEKSG